MMTTIPRVPPIYLGNLLSLDNEALLSLSLNTNCLSVAVCCVLLLLLLCLSCVLPVCLSPVENQPVAKPRIDLFVSCDWYIALLVVAGPIVLS